MRILNCQALQREGMAHVVVVEGGQELENLEGSLLGLFKVSLKLSLRFSKVFQGHSSRIRGVSIRPHFRRHQTRARKRISGIKFLGQRLIQRAEDLDPGLIERIDV